MGTTDGEPAIVLGTESVDNVAGLSYTDADSDL